MDRFFITLTMDLTPEAPEGPGWYIRAGSNEQAFFEPVSIAPGAAYEAARALQQALESTEGELPQIGLVQLAESGTKLIRQATEKALQYAEEQAARISKLRQRLANMPNA